jgi:hypothetical protein
MSEDGGGLARAELDLYSGRPNPSWTLTMPERAELERRLVGMPARAGAARLDDDGGLGYRGITVRASGRDGFELVVRRTEAVVRRGAREQILADEARMLERWLLGTARGRVDDSALEYVERTLNAP